MLGFLKGLFGKGDGNQPAPEAPSKPTAAPASAPATPAAKPAPPAAASSAPAKPAPQPAGPVETTAIHLEAVVAKLPPELKDSVKKPPGGKVTIPVPTQLILEQMPSGVVKVPFGDVRKAAPAGTFTDDASRDDVPVSIPLPEILASINPALLKRRPSQKKIEVPDDVTGLFHKGDMPKAPPAAEPKLAAPAPPERAAEKPGPPPPPAPKPPSPAPAAASPPPPAPKPAEPSAPIAVSPALREMMSAASSAAKPPAPAPAPKPPAPPPPPAPKPPTPPAASVPKPPSPPPAPVAAPAPVIAETGELSVSLADVSKDWPESVRSEMASVKADSTLSLPLADVGNAIRAGKIVFTWKQLRGWIKPAPITAASAQDATSLTLPLSVVVPLFMAKSQPAKAQRKANFDESIPDMFAAGKGGPPAPPAPPASPTTPSAPAPAAAPPPPAPPVTPNQSVQKACGLPGVAGALLVSQDGFLVANQLPPTIKGETIAAFLPQIFGRLSQNTKEMNLGELSVLTFTVDNVPWQLCKAGNLYFAVLGRAGENLPAAQLNPIAAEIGRQTK